MNDPTKSTVEKNSGNGALERINNENSSPSMVKILPTVEEEGAAGLTLGNTPEANGTYRRQPMDMSATLDMIAAQTREENLVVHMIIREVRRHRRETRALREDLRIMQEFQCTQLENKLCFFRRSATSNLARHLCGIRTTWVLRYGRRIATLARPNLSRLRFQPPEGPFNIRAVLSRAQMIFQWIFRRRLMKQRDVGE